MSLVRNLLNMFKGNAVLLTTRSRTNPLDAVPVTADDPLPIVIVRDDTGGSGGGGGTDPGSAREATLQTVSTHTQAVNGNTFILATQAGHEGLHVHLPQIISCSTSVMTVTATPENIPTNTLFDEATVHVVSGAVRRSIGGGPTAQTVLLSEGDSEDIEGAELLAYRVVREGNTDAQLCIDYRTLGQPAPRPPVEDI